MMKQLLVPILIVIAVIVLIGGPQGATVQAQCTDTRDGITCLIHHSEDSSGDYIAVKHGASVITVDSSLVGKVCKFHGHIKCKGYCNVGDYPPCGPPECVPGGVVFDGIMTGVTSIRTEIDGTRMYQCNFDSVLPGSVEKTLYGSLIFYKPAGDPIDCGTGEKQYTTCDDGTQRLSKECVNNVWTNVAFNCDVVPPPVNIFEMLVIWIRNLFESIFGIFG